VLGALYGKIRVFATYTFVYSWVQFVDGDFNRKTAEAVTTNQVKGRNFMEKQLFDAGWEYIDKVNWMPNPFETWQPVNLPHDASIERPRGQQHPTGSGGGYAWSGVLTYRKKIQVPENWKGRSIQLEFEGVYMNAKVFVNGNVAAFHPYGYTSFIVDLTPYLNYGAENDLAVVVNNSAQPNSRWYSGTGIYRHVWLRTGSGVHIPPWGVFVTTPRIGTEASAVTVATEIVNASGAPAAILLRTAVLDAGGKMAAWVETPLEIAARAVMTVTQALNAANVRLWSLDNPYLYTLTSEVLVGGKVVDAEKTSFGFRSIAVDAKNGFRLNGAPMKLKGGCIHHDNGLLGAASYDRAEERKVELLKASGFNAIRTAHNPPAPALLEACDRLGMLVIDETFDCWRMGKNPNDYHLYFEDWWQRDTESMVKRDRNHPSVIMWSVGNEVSERTGVSDGYAWVRKQAECVRALDNTRLVTSALPALFEGMFADTEMKIDMSDMDGLFELGNRPPTDPEKDRWGKLTAPFLASLEVGGYNYLNTRYEFDSQHFPKRVMCGTETWPKRAYATWNDTLRLPCVIGDFVWTAIDYLGESGIGMVTYDGSTGFFPFRDPFPYHLANCGDLDICGFKRPQSYFRDILWGLRKAPYIGVLDPKDYGRKISYNPWGWEPVNDTWTFPGWEGKPTQVSVYSADEEVELIVNGASVGRKPAGAACQNKAVFEVTYQPGTISAVGFTQGKETGRTTLKTTSEPAALRLTADRRVIKAAFGDLAYITVEIVDKDGNVVKHATQEVSFEVSGAGELLAVGTADGTSEALYIDKKRKAFEGRLMAVVRSKGEAGGIGVKASAEGLTGAEIIIKVS
jgi:beta-galactosidase